MYFSAEDRDRVRGSRVLGYRRESMVAKEHKISQDLQTRDVEEVCDELDITIVDWITDSDKTGRNFERNIRDAIQRIERGEADHIGIFNLSRFGRDFRECIYWAGRLNDAGHLLISADDEEGVIDIRTPDGLEKAIKAFHYASQQSEKTGKAWRKVHKRLKSLGITHANTERWGYMWCGVCVRTERCSVCKEQKNPRYCKRCPQRPRCDKCRDKPQIPNPKTAPVVIEVVDKLLAGVSAGSVVRDLNKRGFRTPGEVPWTTTHLYENLDNGFAAGYLRTYGGLPKSEWPRGKRALQEAIYTKGAQDPIISAEKWIAYIALRVGGGDNPWAGQTGKAKYAESGLMWCVACGSKMNAQFNRGKLKWMCSGYQTKNCTHTNADGKIVSGLVYNYIKEFVDNPDFLVEVERSLRAHLAALNAQPIEDFEKFEKLKERLAKERKDLVLNFNRKLIPQDIYAEELPRMDAEILDVERQLAVLTPRNIPTFPPADYVADCFGKWDDLPNENKRALLHRVIWRIEVKKGERYDPERYRIIPLWEAYLHGYTGPSVS